MGDYSLLISRMLVPETGVEALRKVNPGLELFCKTTQACPHPPAGLRVHSEALDHGLYDRNWGQASLESREMKSFKRSCLTARDKQY